VDAVAKLRIDAGDSTVSPTVSIGVTLAAKVKRTRWLW
jgi:hypothetical protein